MPTNVNSILILIASPGDTREERAAVRDAINDWSVQNAHRQNIVALPWLYERHAVAALGDRAQALINAQAVDRADVVVAFFDSRLGTHTGYDVSGTAEEIRRAAAVGKPVHVYFSSEDLPRDVDPKQLIALKDFKTALEQDGLLGDYSDPGDLAAQVTRALEHDVDDNGWGEGSLPRRSSGADPAWEHVHLVDQVGFDRNGKMKTRTRRNDLVLRNLSEVDAEQFEFTIEPVGSDDSHYRFEGPTELFTLFGESELQWSLITLMGTMTFEVHATWIENGVRRERTRSFTTS
ncbi:MULTISPECIES: DUF4062 domain-containing protein [unclassified Curtobacterium]|uniref:DUF4062 domain-containing protein n=1 Tax=unclassified Curtobacterium TaxID=257496 RepID=UPI000F497BAD|nr:MULTISPECIES: DUF4062 domain-containing protein [unclassified Curtobacterium]ROQ16230.1 hypothetical protein EDF41_0906 [Curtobacterium sp. PhB171]ROQ25694.1 hypothetical protein EDF40_2192 [Curtobacterium sp. PhB170]ROS37147.1 hypothetical protein EDF25_1369 [Curtobacterium sp. PhB131]ROS71822.1 hypothetical protein EDF30_1555 [Curtobacterium sp. PhB141]TCL80055.1 hypothetical protein EDF23_102448 [Curtobacterium sp. PhB128]